MYKFKLLSNLQDRFAAYCTGTDMDKFDSI